MLRIIEFTLASVLFFSSTLSGQTTAGTPSSLEAPVTNRQINPAERHRYLIGVASHEFLRVELIQHGVSTKLTLMLPSGEVARIVYHWVEPHRGGRESLNLRDQQPGNYELIVERVDGDSTPGAYDIRIVEREPMEIRLAREKSERANWIDTAAKVSKWLHQQAIPVSTVTPGSNFKDLTRFAKSFDGVRVVALGEATHGTREFFQFKHRMLEYLVRDLGFTLFVMETQYPTALRINDYVLGGPGDGAYLTRGMMVWTWSTEEVRDLIEWMRRYNATVPKERKVKFYGFDIQFVPRSAKIVDRYLKSYSPEFSARASSLLRPILDLDTATFHAYNTRSELERDRFNRDLLEVIGYLSANRARLVQTSSAEGYNEALNAARTLLYSEQARVHREDPNTREVFMALALSDILDANPGAKAVLWGHNGHIAKRDLEGFGTYVPMGELIARDIGLQYYALCFAFNEGEFQAINQEPTRPPGPGLSAFSVPSANEGTLEWFLARPGIPSYLIDFRSAHPSKPVRSWLDNSHYFRHIGGEFFYSGDRDPSEMWYGRIAPSKSCDGLFFIDRTERARPLVRTGRRWSPYDW